MMRILGIDFGLKKIGLALAENSLSQPFGVVKNDPRLLKKINNICQTNQVEKIIIGFSEGKLAERIRGFGCKIAKLTGLTVEFQDESLTSKEAIAKMIEAGKKRKDRRKLEDAVAAALILQSYLDSQK